MTEIIKFFRDELERALTAGRASHDAALEAELAVRRAFAGERPYIAGYPKRQRVMQIERIYSGTSRDAAARTGLSVRRIQQLRKAQRNFLP